jgi:serine-type D-Ala-D-Ala carboxypeptidase (penicillin-binding protein 5/6)
MAITVLGIICVLAAGSWWFISQRTIASLEHISTDALDWPSFGEAAIGIVGSSTVETHGAQTPEPTASTAKLITALVVLQAKPLSLGETGPMLTMSRDDLALLKTYASLDGSRIAKMGVGEQLSEYQMLETMMLPSADNAADSLATWAYGSLPAYSAAANAYLASHGLNDTHVGTDASGLDPSTVSTAHDMVIIGELAMQNPVLAQIVAKQSVSGFPLIGTIKNTDTLLGQSGIVGIKTGNSDQQGGAFVGAANVVINEKTETIVTALMGAPSLPDAMSASLSLIKSAE